MAPAKLSIGEFEKMLEAQVSSIRSLDRLESLQRIIDRRRGQIEAEQQSRAQRRAAAEHSARVTDVARVAHATLRVDNHHTRRCARLCN